jgi:hypothetical protein
LRPLTIKKAPNEDVNYELVRDSDGDIQPAEDAEEAGGLDDNQGDFNFHNELQDHSAPKGGLFDLMEASAKRVN